MGREGRSACIQESEMESDKLEGIELEEDLHRMTTNKGTQSLRPTMTKGIIRELAAVALRNGGVPISAHPHSKALDWEGTRRSPCRGMHEAALWFLGVQAVRSSAIPSPPKKMDKEHPQVR